MTTEPHDPSGRLQVLVSMIRGDDGEFEIAIENLETPIGDDDRYIDGVRGEYPDGIGAAATEVGELVGLFFADHGWRTEAGNEQLAAATPWTQGGMPMEFSRSAD